MNKYKDNNFLFINNNGVNYMIPYIIIYSSLLDFILKLIAKK